MSHSVKPIIKQVARFPAGHAWANRILRIDLDNMAVDAQEALSYLPEYLGARGLAARICWEEYPEPAEPFAPSNPLMIVPGALTGSRAPYSGRSSVCTFSPQAYPHAWFTRSNVGGFFGGELESLPGPASRVGPGAVRSCRQRLLPVARLGYGAGLAYPGAVARAGDGGGVPTHGRWCQ